MIRLGKVSKLTRGTPVEVNKVEDILLQNEGNRFPKRPS